MSKVVTELKGHKSISDLFDPMSVVFSQGEVDSWSRERDRHHQPTGLPAVSCKYPIINASFWRQDILLVSIYNKSADHEMTNLPSSYIKTVCTRFYCTSLWLTFAYFALPAGQDEADDSLQSNNMLSPPVLWCNTLYPDEWEEADLGLSCLRQEGAVWAPLYRRVRRAFVILQRYVGMIIFRPFIFLNVCLPSRLFMEILNSCSDCDEIQFKEDGNWAPMRSKKEVQEVSASFNGVDSGMRNSTFFFCPRALCCFVLVATSCFLSDTSRTETHEPKRSSSDNSKKVDVIDLTLDSSSEDELDDEPPPKRVCPSLSPISPPPTKGWAFHWTQWKLFQGFWSRLRCFISVVNLLWLFPHRVPNLHSQVSPVPRAPSMPPVETSYIPPPPPLIQDYRHYYHAASDLPGRPVTRPLPLVQFIATVISRWCGKNAQN